MAPNVLKFHAANAPKNGPQPVRVGLIGQGIQLSRTPAMHVQEGRALGLSYIYDLIDPDEFEHKSVTLANILDQVEAAGFAGCNVTYPFKKEVLIHLDSLSEPARMVGAVNTVVFAHGRRVGHNTDYLGFAESLRQGLGEATYDTVLLLGAGGAGGAVAHALKSLGVKNLLILDTSYESARALAKAVDGQAVTDVGEAVLQADGIVNATPMGMAKLPGTAIPVELLEQRHWVSDIVYFPRETALLKAAKSRGCQTLDGSGMAVFQAARAFELFTGLEPDPARMRTTFETFSTA